MPEKPAAQRAQRPMTRLVPRVQLLAVASTELTVVARRALAAVWTFPQLLELPVRSHVLDAVIS
jgi:hypothetical protein